MNQIIFWSGIWPNHSTRPIGTYQLAYWLRKHNIESQVIEFCQWYSPEQLCKLTSHFITSKTKYIGISTSFWPNSKIPANIIEGCKIIRKEYPQLKLIFGGPRADSTNVKEIADIVLLGEAENTILSLIKGHNINSLNFDITKLDHKFDERDCIIDGEILPIELGRGCIFKCKFCAHHNIGKAKHTYQRHGDLIKEEMQYNYKHFKTTNYMFLDDTVNEDLDKVKMLSTIPTETGIDIKWVGYLRADLLWRFPDSAHQLQKSGLQSCFFGIETFNKQASQAISKGWSGSHAKDFLPNLYHNIWNRKLNIWCNFIVGLPGETIENLHSTLQWCKDNPIGHHQFTPLSLYANRTDNGPRSEFTSNYKDYGYTLDENKEWLTDIMNERKALDLSIKFNEELSNINRLSSWFLSDLINCGVDMSEGQNILSSTRLTKIKQFDKFLTEYKKKLLAL